MRWVVIENRFLVIAQSFLPTIISYIWMLPVMLFPVFNILFKVIYLLIVECSMNLNSLPCLTVHRPSRPNSTPCNNFITFLTAFVFIIF